MYAAHDIFGFNFSTTALAKISLGMVLGFVSTLIVAGYMSQNYGHWVGGIRSDADSIPLVGWVRSGGDLRVSHFFAMHMMQIIPLVGLIADRCSQRPGRIVIIASTIGLGAVFATFFQALSEQPFI